MKVMIKGIGDLRDYFGKAPREVALSETACLRDLLLRIEQDWGTKLPAYLWDFEKHQFRGPVVLVLNKKVIRSLDAPLQDGMEIHIVRAIAGG